MVKLHMQMLASNKDMLAESLKKVRKENPDTPEISAEKMQDFILGEEYTIEMGNEAYFLKQAMQLGDHIYPSIMMKDICVLKSESVEFITSDYPVSLISDPSIPHFYSGGFLMSGVLIPIGTHTALFFKNPEKPKEPPKPEETITIGYKSILSDYAEWINDIAINHAERFLFGTSKNAGVKVKFDKTTQPQRFHMSSPFSRKKTE